MNAVARLAPRDSWPSGVWTVSAGNAAQGVALAAREAGATRLGAGHGHGAGRQTRRHRTPRRHHRQGDVRRMLARRRVARIGSHDRPPRASVRRRRLHQRQRHGRAGNSRRRAGRGRGDRADRRRRPARRHRVRACARCGPTRASTAPNRRPRRRWRASLAAGAPMRFENWKASFVDGAGGRSVLPSMWPLLESDRQRVHRRLAGRSGAGHAIRRRALPRHHRRRGGVCGRRGAFAARWLRPATRKSSPSSPAATSISAEFAQLVGACA